MNITFFIGNGFDIGLGLKTSYKDFYKYFFDNANDKNIIKKELIDAKKSGTHDNWSDLEKALGEYTAKLDLKDSREFEDSKDELDELLLDYLLEEEKKVNLEESLDKNTIGDIVTKALYSIRQGTTEEEGRAISRVLSAYINGNYIYCAINFNYTRCFDDIFSVAKISKPVIGEHSSYKELIGGTIHVHGTLEDKQMLLGVNDESQIKNIEYRSLGEIRRSMIKPYLNDEIGNNRNQKVKEVIDESGIICIYGMSIGDTDKIWWEYIGKWLVANSHRILMIYVCDPTYRGRLPKHKLNYERLIRENFIMKAGMTEEDSELLKKRIIVYINNNIWQISNYIKENEDIAN